LKKLKFYKEIEEFKENFDALISKVESLETFSIDDAC
jgi:predicted nuclease with TOPRIM domain